MEILGHQILDHQMVPQDAFHLHTGQQSQEISKSRTNTELLPISVNMHKHRLQIEISLREKHHQPALEKRSACRRVLDDFPFVRMPYKGHNPRIPYTCSGILG